MDTIIDNINKSPKTTIKKIYEYIVSNIVTSDCYDIILSSKTDYLLQQQKKIYAICLSSVCFFLPQSLEILINSRVSGQKMV